MASREVKGANPCRGDGCPISVLWMTAGLGCDGESVAMTAATPPSLMPFIDPDPRCNAAADLQRFTYGPLFRHFRKRNFALKFEQEPAWRGQPAPPGDAPNAHREGRRS